MRTEARDRRSKRLARDLGPKRSNVGTRDPPRVLQRCVDKEDSLAAF